MFCALIEEVDIASVPGNEKLQSKSANDTGRLSSYF